MDQHLLIPIIICFTAIVVLGIIIAYKLGKLHGAKEYYNLLSKPTEEERIQ